MSKLKFFNIIWLHVCVQLFLYLETTTKCKLNKTTFNNCLKILPNYFVYCKLLAWNDLTFLQYHKLREDSNYILSHYLDRGGWANIRAGLTIMQNKHVLRASREGGSLFYGLLWFIF